MKLVTASEMQAIDRKTIKDYGIPSHTLMENAGVSVANKIKGLFTPQEVIVIAGRGNNGGDGIVAARELYKSGWEVKVILLDRQENLSPDCLVQYKTAKQLGLLIEFKTHINEKDIHEAVVVDAIFGTGLRNPIKGALQNVILSINKSGCPVVSVDIPSGVSSDTGQTMGIAVKASFTVTFGLPKRGHFLYPGAEHTGRLFVSDIGFPESLLKDKRLICQIIERQDILIPKRHRYSHKGDYGHVLIVAGSRGKTGAPLMTAKACLRTGAGLVTIGVPESLMDVIGTSIVEEMTLALPERKKGIPSLKALDVILKFLNEKADVLAIGPGIGAAPEISKLIQGLLKKCTRPMVIDADAINVLKMDMLKGIQAPIILTPHPGEMARLKGISTADIEKNRINTAISFTKDINDNITLVLKGVPTVIASKKQGVFVNTLGNPAMAKAGSGDVLTGMIAGLLAQGLSPISASITAVYLHGMAGDISASQKGEHSVLASDIIEAIGEAFLSLKA